MCVCVCDIQARSREAPLMSTRTKINTYMLYYINIYIRYILVTTASMHSGAPVFTQLIRRRRTSLCDSDAWAKNVTRHSSAILLGHSVCNIRKWICARAFFVQECRLLFTVYFQGLHKRQSRLWMFAVYRETLTARYFWSGHGPCATSRGLASPVRLTLAPVVSSRPELAKVSSSRLEFAPI